MALMQLDTGAVLQGTFALHRVNLMLVFQVNCPGCLSQALPQLETIQHRFPALNCFALSSAFEDFGLNNQANTEKLLHEGVMPLASARHFSRLGHALLPYKITVPVLMDRFADVEQMEAFYQSARRLLGETGLNQTLTDQTQQLLSQRLQPLLLSGRTFLNNQLQGTPSWCLFDDAMQIIDQWFGHRPLEWIEAHVAVAMGTG